MNSSPWDNLDRPTKDGTFYARLLSEEESPKQRRIFWALRRSGQRALLVEYNEEPWRPMELPRFKNIQVEDFPEEGYLAIELLDIEMSDFFLRLCLDVISALQGVSARSIRKVCVLRLERWCQFLRPSRPPLGQESQKGLIAELKFLQHAIESSDEKSALRGWVGPESSPRDFAYGQTFIEVKSKRSSANSRVSISSEEQLNVNPSERLFLYVVELNSAPLQDSGAFSVTDAVGEVRTSLASPISVAIFDNKLASIGFFEEDDYSDVLWSEGLTYSYEVVDGFPKIDSSTCAPGLSGVSYQIDLTYCTEYLVDIDLIDETLGWQHAER